MRKPKAINVVVVAFWLLIIGAAFFGFTRLNSGELNNNPICSVADYGPGARVVVNEDDNGQVLCLRRTEAAPEGYKEFPGGPPQLNNDDRWLQYQKQHPYKPGS